MLNEIKNKIIKTELINWKKFQFLQDDQFKKYNQEDLEALKHSIVKNSFIETFKVWQNDKTIFCLDGFHRCKALEEIETYGLDGNFYKVPAKFTASFIDCKNIEEAAKLVLIYSSQYAKVDKTGLENFLDTYELDLNSFQNELDIPNIKLQNLSVGKDNEIKALTETIRPYKRTHILLSFKPEMLRLLKPLLTEIENLNEIEIEQSSN